MTSLVSDRIEPTGASKMVIERLNGISRGSAPLWAYEMGDWARCIVTHRESYKSRYDGRQLERLELRFEEGIEAGQVLPLHAHRVLLCNHVELQRMVRLCNPQVGSELTIAYLGRDDSRRPSSHLFRYHLEGNGHADVDDF
jgi:hypothetical protein